MACLVTMTCNSKAAEGQIGSHADYVSSRLRDTSLFCKLSQQEISCFEAAVQTRSYKKGKVLRFMKTQKEPSAKSFLNNE